MGPLMLGPTRDETLALTSEVEHHGWPRGVERFLDTLEPEHAEHFRLSLNVAHTGWLGLLPAGAAEHAVGIDPGLGTVLVALARRYRRVTGLFRDARLLALVHARLEWLGVTNIDLIDATSGHPRTCGDPAADAVVMYLRDARALNDAAVDRFARSLRPGGALYVGVQAPAGWRALRQAAALRARLRGAFPQVESYRQYRGLMLRDQLVAMDDPNRGLVGRARGVLGAVRAPAFAFVARQAPVAPSVCDEVLSGIAGGAAAAPASIDQYSMTVQGGCVLNARVGGERAIVRMAFSPEMQQRCAVNASALDRLAQLRVEGVPRLIAAADAGPQPYVAESVLEGQPVSARVLQTPASRTAWLRDAVRWIAALHRQTAVTRPLDSQRFQRLIVEPFNRATDIGYPAPRADVQTVRDYLLDTLAGQPLPLVFSHGDYSVDNMLCDGASFAVRGVFDWDCAAEESLPLVDVLYLLFTARRAQRGDRYIANTYREYLFASAFDAEERELLQEYCGQLGVDSHLLLPLTIMTWTQHALRIDYDEWYRSTESTRGIVWNPLHEAAKAVRREAPLARRLAVVS